MPWHLARASLTSDLIVFGQFDPDDREGGAVPPDLVATAAVDSVVPMPLHGHLRAIQVAKLLAWLASEENTHLCGQTIYIDGGSDVVLRGES